MTASDASPSLSEIEKYATIPVLSTETRSAVWIYACENPPAYPEGLSSRAGERSGLGRCPKLLAALQDARRYARGPAPVVITGPTGSGKERVARFIHQSSPRQAGPFVVLDCTNLPENLIEDELFGHRKNAFTGASAARAGLIEEASGGTLFLDEIGDLPLTAQAKLLRFLQERTIKRIGANEQIAVDVRVVAATWRDLREQVAAGAFRDDLYQRLAWGIVALPPLCERGHDILLLARDFLQNSPMLEGCRKGLQKDAGPVLLDYHWPGNVRELQRVMFRAAMLGTGERVSGEDVARVLEREAVPVPGSAGSLEERVIAAMEELGEARAQEIAHAVGISRSHLQRLLAPMVSAGRVEVAQGGNATRYRLASHNAHFADPRWNHALRVMQVEGRITRGRLAEISQVSERTAGRILREMVEAGLLVSDGRSGRYQGYVPLRLIG